MFLNAVLTLGILSSLLGLSELLLRKSQRDTIGLWVDNFVLSLEYTRPLEWFNSLQRPNPTIPFCVFMVYAFLFPFLAEITFFVKLNSYRFLNIIFYLFYLLSLLGMGLLIPALIFWKSGSSVLRLLQGADTLLSLASQSLNIARKSIAESLKIGILAALVNSITSMIILSLISFILYIIYGNRFENIVDSNNFEFIGIFVTVITYVTTITYLRRRNPDRFMLWQIGLPLVLSVIVLGITLSIFELSLKFVRGLLWRIAEFQKGPVAAITLLLTTVLALVKLFAVSK